MSVEARSAPGAGAMSVGEIERELARLRMNEDGTLGARASVLNLIVPTDEASAPGVTRGISGLASRYPSRAIVLISDPDEPEPNLEVSLSAFCSVKGGSGGQVVCTEHVTVHAEGPPAGHLESFAGPLLVPDLPAFLWYPRGRVPEGTDGLAALADRLILNSGAAGAPEASLRAAAELLLLGDEDAPAVGDLQWTALSTWRALVADLFAPPEGTEELERIESVEVLHDGAAAGECRALLFVAWLSVALDWHPGSSREVAADGGREILFHTPSGGEVAVTLDPTANHHYSGAPLSRVLLRAGDHAYRVERQGTDDARATVTRGEDLLGERTVRLGPQEAGDLLGEELHFLGRDEAYEAALKRAVELLDLLP